MADWLYDDRSRSAASPLESLDGLVAGPGEPGGQRLGASAFLGLIPFLQLACIGGAVIIVTSAPPILGALAWFLGAVAVPMLWAMFFVGFKQRNVGSGLWKREHRRKRLNHVLLLIGIGVGMWGAFGFATEVAK